MVTMADAGRTVEMGGRVMFDALAIATTRRKKNAVECLLRKFLFIGFFCFLDFILFADYIHTHTHTHIYTTTDNIFYFLFFTSTFTRSLYNITYMYVVHT